MACGVQDPGSKVKPLPHAALAVLRCWITPAYPIVVFLGNTSGYCLSGHVLKALHWGLEVRRKEIKGQEGRRGLSWPWQNKDNVRVFRALRCVVRMYWWKHNLKYANWFSFVALPAVSTNERDTFLLNPLHFTVTSECVIIVGVPVWITWLWGVESWSCVLSAASECGSISVLIGLFGSC